jgi:hypothetical protein
MYMYKETAPMKATGMSIMKDFGRGKIKAVNI